MKTFFLRYIAVLVVLGLCSSKVYAENAVINDIQVTGNQRIEASTIISWEESRKWRLTREGGLLVRELN